MKWHRNVDATLHISRFMTGTVSLRNGKSMGDGFWGKLKPPRIPTHLHSIYVGYGAIQNKIQAHTLINILCDLVPQLDKLHIPATATEIGLRAAKTLVMRALDLRDSIQFVTWLHGFSSTIFLCGWNQNPVRRRLMRLKWHGVQNEVGVHSLKEKLSKG